MATAASAARIPITTRSSISVNPCCPLFLINAIRPRKSYSSEVLFRRWLFRTTFVTAGLSEEPISFPSIGTFGVTAPEEGREEHLRAWACGQGRKTPDTPLGMASQTLRGHLFLPGLRQRQQVSQPSVKLQCLTASNIVPKNEQPYGFRDAIPRGVSGVFWAVSSG